ncbi:MAG: mandelate racemase/muconate lactonizing enzyme family protein [Chloroflexi bacterium]|nr:mandelate racemase/muconate lactonizing enzyme family protein [Chloroflexota bacterium]
MKISQVSTKVMGTPWRNLLFVKVETDEGLVGWAEARPVGGVGPVIGYLKETVPDFALGQDPFNTEALVYRMLRETYGRAGEIAMTGIALLEIACWDIIGKALGQPLYRLLGGAMREQIKAYANGWYRVERQPDAWHDAAKEVIAKGYRALKFDPFGSGFYEFTRQEKLLSIALVEAVYDAVGPDVELLIEMHGRFNPVTAAEIIRDLAEFRPAWIEEPVPPENLRALRDVREMALPLGIPVATGERIHTPYEYRELFELGAADIIQTDITHFGGIGNMKKLAGTAEMYYVLVAPHNVGGPCSTMASLAVAATTPNFKIQEYFNDFADPPVKAVGIGMPEVVDGYFPLPSKPGLGLDIDEDLIDEYPQRQTDFNLFSDDWHRRDLK